MQGIVSALPPKYEQTVFELWEEMEQRFQAHFARTALIPHFTWQLAMEDYVLENLIPQLDAFCKTLKPINIHVQGARLFPGPLPTIYLRIIKSKTLKDLHRRLWERFSPFAHGSNHLYSSETWVPHITIVHKDLAQENVEKALDLLAERQIDWRFEVANLLILRQDPDQIATLDYRFRFGEGLVYTAPSRTTHTA
jgi:2'-5' RNA ligase